MHAAGPPSPLPMLETSSDEAIVVCLVTGPAGSGRSMFAHKLCARISKEWGGCRIAAVNGGEFKGRPHAVEKCMAGLVQKLSSYEGDSCTISVSDRASFMKKVDCGVVSPLSLACDVACLANPFIYFVYFHSHVPLPSPTYARDLLALPTLSCALYISIHMWPPPPTHARS